jgi:DNA-directed RNA polymerase sigma subunit (sigma70/sigma32)
MTYDVPDETKSYNIDLMNAYLMGIMKQYLSNAEYEVIRLSYGMDCDKHSAKQIAVKLNITGVSNYVRISEIKKAAIDKLIANVDSSQVIDFL